LFKKLFQKNNSSSPEQTSTSTNIQQSSLSQADTNRSGSQNPKGRGRPSQKRQKNTKKSAPVKKWDESQFAVPEVEGKTRFHDLQLEPELMHAIADLGFEYCTDSGAISAQYPKRSRLIG